MLLNKSTLEGIKAGRISMQFRRWKRPTVKAGGTLMTIIGQLAIDDLDVVDPAEISEAEARAAGYEDLGTLLKALDRHETGNVYRVLLRFLGADPRESLRQQIPDSVEMEVILHRLEGFDKRSSRGTWTLQALAVIQRRPRQPAASLADEVGLEKAPFKVNIRKLKGLGLTESLDVGYRLSPRGQAVLDRLALSFHIR